MPAALDQLHVLEVGSGLAAAYAAKLLADLGASVIKVEPPRDGDATRARGPFPGDVPHPEKSGLFLYLNANKRGITLDLTRPRGREVLERLAARAAPLSPAWRRDAASTWRYRRRSAWRPSSSSPSSSGPTAVSSPRGWAPSRFSRSASWSAATGGSSSAASRSTSGRA